MAMLVSSNSPNPKIIPETSKDLPRIVSTSCKFRISMDQRTIKIKLPKISEKTKRKKETDTDKKRTEENGKRHFIRPKMVFPVKKMTSVISGIFSRKKTLAGEQRDDSAEITEAAGESLVAVKVKPKQNPLQKKQRFWERARIRLKILILGKRLKTRRRSLSVGEDEQCKKRILMGERCKPMNRSGILQYDDDGVLLPEP